MNKLLLTGLIVGGLSAQTPIQNAAAPVQPTNTASSDYYGFRPGTIGGYVAGGFMHESGFTKLNPAVGGGFEVGIHKYVGTFVDVGYSHLSDSATVCYARSCATANIKLNYYQFGGGLEVIGSNRSHFVPYGKFGFDYIGADASGNVSGGGYYASGRGYASAPALQAGGGLRGYFNHNVGLNVQLSVFRTLGVNGGSTIVAPTVGVFFQTR